MKKSYFFFCYYFFIRYFYIIVIFCLFFFFKIRRLGGFKIFIFRFYIFIWVYFNSFIKASLGYNRELRMPRKITSWEFNSIFILFRLQILLRQNHSSVSAQQIIYIYFFITGIGINVPLSSCFLRRKVASYKSTLYIMAAKCHHRVVICMLWIIIFEWILVLLIVV